MQPRVTAAYVHAEARRISAVMIRSPCSSTGHRAALEMTRALAEQTAPQPATDPEGLQLELMLEVQITADFIFGCRALHCILTAAECAHRQLASDGQKNNANPERGQASDYPYCTSGKCGQGAEIRRRLEPAVLLTLTWRGRGPNGRFSPGRSDGAEQEQARQRLSANGALDAPPTLDAPLDVHGENE